MKLKRMLTYILVGLAVAIGGILIAASTRPTDFRVARSGAISAPPEAVFPHVNDFHKWEAWSPWAKLDPNCKNTFEGSAAGQGAVFSWAGNNKVGEGRMTITESKPSELIQINLEFIKPFKATNTTLFTFQREGNKTVVNWSMEGKNNFMGKVVSLFMDCDKMVGGQFEQGLAQMKAVVEGKASRDT